MNRNTPNFSAIRRVDLKGFRWVSMCSVRPHAADPFELPQSNSLIYRKEFCVMVFQLFKYPLAGRKGYLADIFSIFRESWKWHITDISRGRQLLTDWDNVCQIYIERLAMQESNRSHPENTTSIVKVLSCSTEKGIGGSSYGEGQSKV